jgi:hypothetical protein
MAPLAVMCFAVLCSLGLGAWGTQGLEYQVYTEDISVGDRLSQANYHFTWDRLFWAGIQGFYIASETDTFAFLLEAAFAESNTGRWHFEGELIGEVTSSSTWQTAMSKDYRYTIRYLAYHETRDTFLRISVARPGSSTYAILNGSDIETCLVSGCRNQAYTRSNACQPTRTPTPRTPTPTPPPTPTGPHTTECFTPGIRQELYSIRRVFLAINRFAFALEA